MTGWDDRVAALPLWGAPAPPGRAVVVVAHPDDETLALTGVVRGLVTAGWHLDLLCLTAGEAAYPSLDAVARARLATVRRDEIVSAWGDLTDRQTVTVVGLPDSGLDTHEDDVRTAVTVAAADADLVVSLWDDDPHADHAVAGRAVLDTAAGRPVLLAPLWARAWFTPAHPMIPWDRCRRVVLDDDARSRRRSALGRHASQVDGFEGLPGLVDDDTVAVFAGDDVVVVGPGPT